MLEPPRLCFENLLLASGFFSQYHSQRPPHSWEQAPTALGGRRFSRGGNRNGEVQGTVRTGGSGYTDVLEEACAKSRSQRQN